MWELVGVCVGLGWVRGWEWMEEGRMGGWGSEVGEWMPGNRGMKKGKSGMVVWAG
jgi:hypothetical protein